MSRNTNITATETRKEIFRLLDKVYYENQTFTIIRHGRVVAKLAKPENPTIETWEIPVKLALKCLLTEEEPDLT